MTYGVKLFSVLFAIYVCTSVGFSQYYSSKCKKAVKLYVKARQAPNIALIENTNIPDYPKGIFYLEKALKKDNNFVEAHILKARYHEAMKEFEQAIFHYGESLKINSPLYNNIESYFDIASLQLAIGSYEDALFNISVFLKDKGIPEKLYNAARGIEANARFAVHSIKNPKAFDPINVGPGINTQYSEYFPTLTVDGKTMLFTRLLPVPNGNPRDYSDKQEDFFVSFLEKNTWNDAFPMPNNVNTQNNEGAPSISADGKSLIFVACSDQSGVYYGPNRNGKGSCDLFYTKRFGSRWMNPINLPGNVNTQHWETQPSLSADGKTLYFIRGVRDRNGNKNADIYVSYLQADGTWSSGIPLPNHINTPKNEESVHIHPDGRTLYFASRGHIGMGGSDLYVTRLDNNGNWSKPENLGYPINTKFNENSLMVSSEGDIAFFASNRTGGYGELDIYYFKIPDEIKPTKTFYFDGVVYDAQTKNVLGAHFELKDLASGETVIISDADPTDGSFKVALPIHREYAIQVLEEGYFPYSLNFNLNIDEGQNSYHIDVPMNPKKSTSENVLANVFFDLNKSSLRKESIVELDGFVQYLTRNVELKIELGGHTDSRGDFEENRLLSEQRAKAVCDYLIKNGIAKERLSFKGYGSSEPIVSDDEIEKLQTAKEKNNAHQKNRRTSYKIIE